MRPGRPTTSRTRAHPLKASAAAPQSGSSPAKSVTVAGIAISHPDRVLFAESATTKVDLARYYDAVSERMLPHLIGRPLTLLRCVKPIDAALDKGGCTMIKHAKAWGPLPLRRVSIEEVHKTGEYLIADDRVGLVSLAQMGVVEIHTWNARADAPYAHDRLVLDLDPGPAVKWSSVVTAARALRTILADVGLESWVKTTGGRGLHVVAPIEPTDWQKSLAFARSVADVLVAHEPRLYTTAMAKAGREGKILIDVLRNNRANTAVAAYSVRARTGAPVSTPVAWDEVTPRLDPTSFSISTLPARIRQEDPWSDYHRARQPLPDMGTVVVPPTAGPTRTRPTRRNAIPTRR